MKTKEKQREYMREYNLNNRVKRAAQAAARYRANKEKIKKKNAAHYQANKEKIKANKRAHHREQCIRDWIRRGVKLRPTETWKGMYDKYITALKCESCDIELDDTLHITRRNLDHMHDPPYYIRGTICHSCNAHDNWRKQMTPYSKYQQYM